MALSKLFESVREASTSLSELDDKRINEILLAVADEAVAQTPAILEANAKDLARMDSANPMIISEKNGVAYDPSCVQHMVRISEGNLSKGLVFGVLDVAKREIIWLEMPFTSQTLRGADATSIEVLLHKLEAKLSVGQLLDLKAKAQNLMPVEKAEDADEAYTYEWALNPAEVTTLLNM